MAKTTRAPERRIAVEGEIVELGQHGGERWALLLIGPAVLEVPVGARRDLHLGDRVVVRGRLLIETVGPPAGGAVRGPGG